MGKKAGSKASKGASAAGPALPFLATDERVLDPAVTSLFEQSAGPVHAPAYRNVTKLLSEQKREQQQEQQSRRRGDAGVEDEEGEEEEEEEHPISEHSSDSDNDDDDDDESMSDVDDAEASIPPESSRKRKRSAAKADEDLEDVYMQKLMQREAKEKDAGAEAEKKKRRKVVAPLGDDSETESEDEDEDEDEDVETDADDATSDSDDDDDDDGTAPPVHESLTAEAEKSALDQSRRTVFVGNVSIEAIRSKAAKKTLMEHLVSFAVPHPKSKSPRSEKQSDKPEEQQEGGEKPRIESLRFRSVAFSDASLPKRAAYAKKELMDSTTHSTNAYVVYTTPAAALRAPAALNGSVVLDRHLRVDSVAHPAPVDHKRCVFVGNLAFVDKEAGKEGEDGDDAKKSKSKKRRDAPPADVEEGQI
ncbi:Nucleolar protein 12 [Ascosphaera acerosa]|nr:Nucleolar protein 12 [Ascosphaera acerosa]